MSVKPITERITLVDTLALGQEGTVAVYLLKGSKIALVDCGYASSHNTILQRLKELGIPPSEVSYLIPTHVHLDHAGGAGHLLHYMPKAQVIAHEKAVSHLVDPRKLIESATAIFGEEIMRAYGVPVPVEQERIVTVRKEMAIDLGDGLSLTAIHTPGHAPHQISLVVEREKIVISADAVGIVYPSVPTLIPTTPPPSFDPEKLASSLDTLSHADSKSLLVPHFGVRSDVSQVLEATKRKTGSWLHKVRRLRNKGMTLDEVVRVMRVDVAAEAGMNLEDLPAYAQLSIRVTAMGILHYIERNLSQALGATR